MSFREPHQIAVTHALGQVQHSYEKGEQVTRLYEPRDSGRAVKKKYYICCRRQTKDLKIEYRLKTTKDGKVNGKKEKGFWVEEDDLDFCS